jgi:hypothetical protein
MTKIPQPKDFEVKGARENVYIDLNFRIADRVMAFKRIVCPGPFNLAVHEFTSCTPRGRAHTFNAFLSGAEAEIVHQPTKKLRDSTLKGVCDQNASKCDQNQRTKNKSILLVKKMN